MNSIKLFFTLISFLSATQALAALTLDQHFPSITNPLLHSQLQVSQKSRFALACNPHHRIASWVMFELTDSDLDRQPRLKRLNSYSPDFGLSGPCVVNDKDYKDYTKAGYDRGHLADAESFSGSPTTNKEVANTANLTPQDLSFNRGIWAKLEAWQREQARIEKQIVVFVGPLLDPHLPYLAAGISIPEKFYKIIIDMTPPQKVIAFIIDQNDRGDFRKHAVCADRVEALSGLRFAEHLLESQKDSLFTNCDASAWNDLTD